MKMSRVRPSVRCIAKVSTPPIFGAAYAALLAMTLFAIAWGLVIAPIINA